MRRLPILGTMLVLIPLVIGVGGATAATSRGGPTVEVTGSVTMQQNQFFGVTYRFAPTAIKVPSGAVLTFEGATQPPEPHTASIVRRQDLPTTAMEALQCGRGLCGRILQAHEQKGPILDPDGDGGLNRPGDSIALRPGVQTTRLVTAPPGTTLYYLCAIHPWMQGIIQVTS
jgi:hypothetical protein